MVARIYRPAKTAMQSGQAKSKQWVLDYDPEVASSVEPLMGWTSSADMKSQLRLHFESKEDAITYAKRNRLSYRVNAPKEKKRMHVAYADNFRSDRRIPWTH